MTDTLYRVLKWHTSGEPRRVATAVSDDKGWEAWRQLHRHFEPNVRTREANVYENFACLIKDKAKSPKTSSRS